MVSQPKPGKIIKKTIGFFPKSSSQKGYPESYFKACKSNKAKVDRVRRVDDKLYLEERPNREKEGVYSGQVGMKSFISEILDQPTIGDRARVGRVVRGST